MDFHLPSEDSAFREEVRTFLHTNLPGHLPRAVRRLGYLGQGRKNVLEWTRILYKKGWSAPNWPKESGGTGWTPIQQHIFEEECWNADAPMLGVAGLSLLGPVIHRFGNDEQKAKFLPLILKGEVWLAQGFSEPNAGSDLASLKTTAVLDGDWYVVNGSKIWTSGAHHADWGFFLVRTDPSAKAQKGISFLLIDMKSPGVTLRPIVSIDGMHHLNQTFLENVRVPRQNLVGEPGQGWEFGKFLLENERTTSALVNYTKHEWEKARGIARLQIKNGRPLAEDPEFGRRLACARIELQALEYSVLRALYGERSRYHSIAVASVLKLRGSELQQKVAELSHDALGPLSLRAFTEGELRNSEGDSPNVEPYVVGRTADYLMTRAATIYGGSQQVQRGILAKLAFGL